jgi:DNA-binding transcriptional LysR family regulator
MDRLEAMSLLVEAVDAGSLSAAGRAVGMPLPTVSRKIADLEAHMGTRLLVRSTRRLGLTDAGEAYVAEARHILELVGDAERAASGEYSAPRGELVLSAPVMFGRLHVLPVVVEFLARFPNINVRLMLSDRNAHLTDEHVDMVVRVGKLPDSSMTATRVGAVRHRVCASPAFLAEHGTPKSPAELAMMPCIAHDFAAPSETWPFRAPGAKADMHVPIRVRLAVGTAEAAIDAAAAGVGLTRLISYQVADALADGRLRAVLEDYERSAMPVSLMHAAQGRMPLKMRTFLDFAAPKLRGLLAGSDEGGPDATTKYA